MNRMSTSNRLLLAFLVTLIVGPGCSQTEDTNTSHDGNDTHLQETEPTAEDSSQPEALDSSSEEALDSSEEIVDATGRDCHELEAGSCPSGFLCVTTGTYYCSYYDFPGHCEPIPTSEECAARPAVEPNGVRFCRNPVGESCVRNECEVRRMGPGGSVIPCDEPMDM